MVQQPFKIVENLEKKMLKKFTKLLTKKIINFQNKLKIMMSCMDQ